MRKHIDTWNRKSIRLEGYNYGEDGLYFITICTKNREPYFGEIQNGIMGLNEYGCMVHACWNAIPHHFPYVVLDRFVVVPNHVHGILMIDKTGYGSRELNGDACRGVACYAPTDDAPTDDAPTDDAPTDDAKTMDIQIDHNHLIGPKPDSLGSIIRSFKSAVCKRINEQRGTPGAPVWQRNFYEHIIRPGNALDHIRTYITQNPQLHTQDNR